MRRMGMVIGIRPERAAEYKELHANCWPEIRATIAACGIRNYTIFLREPENLLFGCWEYHGEDFEADMRRMAADEATRRWWALCGPCQAPLESRKEGEWWAMMEEVFHQD
jgi:L-rhamnose mutarotase